MLITHDVVVSAQTGVLGEQVHSGTQVPSRVSVSTLKHMAPLTQLSTPLTPLPWTRHVSPGPTGFGSTGVHLAAFQDEPPLSAQAEHFSPAGQSWAHTSHWTLGPPMSGGRTNPPPSDPAISGGVSEIAVGAALERTGRWDGRA